MLMYDFILYKHVFESMYALHVYHALSLSRSATMRYSLTLVPVLQSSTPSTHVIMMHRQSEKNVTHTHTHPTATLPGSSPRYPLQ